MVQMAREEIDTLVRRDIELSQQLKVLLLPKDPLDERNIMLEVRELLARYARHERPSLVHPGITKDSHGFHIVYVHKHACMQASSTHASGSWSLMRDL